MTTKLIQTTGKSGYKLDYPAELSYFISMTTELEKQLVAFERATGLSLTLYDLRRRLEQTGIPRSRMLHHTAFCSQVKKTLERQCILCDQGRLFTECLNRETPFIRTCHAGADELIIPVMLGGELLCVIFIGQFIIEERTELPNANYPTLPTFSRSQAEHLVSLGEVLWGHLVNSISASSLPRMPLAEQVHSFISDHLSNDPDLSDLAFELNLSLSRTRHVVKEACGKPFSQIKNGIRIGVAKELLTRTNASLKFIARQVGFSDVDYFCRFFKKHSGMTAGAYRRGKGPSRPNLTA